MEELTECNSSNVLIVVCRSGFKTFIPALSHLCDFNK